LRDENNRLKGEQGKPKIKPNTPPPPAPDYSSERERRQARERGKRGKRIPVPIDREQTLSVDPATLPADAEFKGYEEVVVQDVVIRTDNVLFRKQKFYSPSQPAPTLLTSLLAIMASSVPASTPWCWSSTLPVR